ncbi:MAG: hypothetical protein ACYTFV_04065 [Planctomycetota bacterium]
MPAFFGEIPDEIALVGLELFAQGAFVDVAGSAPVGEAIWASSGLGLRVGV